MFSNGSTIAFLAEHFLMTLRVLEVFTQRVVFVAVYHPDSPIIYDLDVRNAHLLGSLVLLVLGVNQLVGLKVRGDPSIGLAGDPRGRSAPRCR